MQGKTAIAVFGRADLREGSEAYEEAGRMGELLAGAGFTVFTGGYEGAMEAASRGAVKAGGRSVGVPCRAFGTRRLNPYLTEAAWTRTLSQRMQRLIDSAEGYVALAPGAGTFSEVMSLLAMKKAGLLSARPLVLMGPPWREALETLGRLGIVEENLLQWPSFVGGPREALAVLVAQLEES